MGKDWTTGIEGRSNSSKAFNVLVKAVEGILRNSGPTIVRGGLESVARNIVAKLAHTYHVGPVEEVETTCISQEMDLNLGQSIRHTLGSHGYAVLVTLDKHQLPVAETVPQDLVDVCRGYMDSTAYPCIRKGFDPASAGGDRSCRIHVELHGGKIRVNNVEYGD